MADEKQVKGPDLKAHIAKIEDKKKDLIEQGRAMMAEGMQNSPEYDAIVEKHRMLRGKQRFFEDSLAEQEKAKKTEEANDSMKSSTQALDDLRSQMMEQDRR